MPALPHIFERAPIPEAAPAAAPVPLPYTSPEDLTLRLLGTKRAPILEARQDNVLLVPEQTYAGLNSGPAPGTVVGIVLGSVGGFLLLIWLLWTISNGNPGVIKTGGELEEVSQIRVRRDSSRRTRSRRTEIVGSRSGSPARRVYRSERIVREFDDDDDRSRSPSNARSRGASRVRSTIIVDERVPGDDIIEVMEEHDSIGPRRKSRRSDRSRY